MPNRNIELNTYYPVRSDLPAVWSGILNANPGFGDHITLYKVLGFKLSDFDWSLKLGPGVKNVQRAVAMGGHLPMIQTDGVCKEYAGEYGDT